MIKFRITGRFCGDKTFPSLNQYIAEIAKNPKAGGRYKRKYADIASDFIRADLGEWRTDKPIILHYTFAEPLKGKKRDRGNIFSCADKIIEDALQKCGVIPDDNPDFVVNFTHEFLYTDKEPYIEVCIELANEW